MVWNVGATGSSCFQPIENRALTAKVNKAKGYSQSRRAEVRFDLEFCFYIQFSEWEGVSSSSFAMIYRVCFVRVATICTVWGLDRFWGGVGLGLKRIFAMTSGKESMDAHGLGIDDSVILALLQK